MPHRCSLNEYSVPCCSTVLERTDKVVVFGGGSFGTAMAAALARQRRELSVTMVLRDAAICHDINQQHKNTRYLTVRGVTALLSIALVEGHSRPEHLGRSRWASWDRHSGHRCCSMLA